MKFNDINQFYWKMTEYGVMHCAKFSSQIECETMIRNPTDAKMLMAVKKCRQ